MASSPITPSTPEDNTPRRLAMNRSFTVPPKLSAMSTRPANPTAEIGAADGIETLYVHPNASIIKFTTPSTSRPSSSSPGSRGQPSTGAALLPWASPTESTVAAGPLEIYRVPGSVSFLHSGALLHAILPRSQCWCVDGLSKFAFRVLPDTYYRIELPGSSPEDLVEVEKLKETLRKVLFYERTPCPFARGFEVDLPEESPMDVRKRRRKSTGPAKKWRLERGMSWRPEGWEKMERERRASEASTEGSAPGSEEDEESDSAEAEGSSSSGARTPAEEEQATAGADAIADDVKTLQLRAPALTRPRALAASRSITAPPQLTLQSTPPSRLRTTVNVDGSVEISGSGVFASREEAPPRLRPFQPIPTDMPPSPPDSSAGMEYVEARGEIADRVTKDSMADGNESLEKMARENSLPGPDSTPASSEQESVPVQPSSVSNGERETVEVARNSEEEGRVSQQVDEGALGGPQDSSTALTNPSQPAQNEKPEPVASTQTATEASQDINTQAQQPSVGNDTQHEPPIDEDPYAAIRARILARRSIGGPPLPTTTNPPPTRHSTTSSSSSSSSSLRFHHRSSTTNTKQQAAFASALVRKACAVFLGPPAHLVAMMLRIAARVAAGSVAWLYVESDGAGRGNVPGSFRVDDGEDEGWFGGGDRREDEREVDGEEEEDDGREDDFGVPLRSPVRLARVGSAGQRREEAVRQRRGRDG